MYNKLIIAGGGPGHPDYILPVVLKRLEAAEVVGISERFEKDLRERLDGKEIVEIGGGTPLKDSLKHLERAVRDGKNTLLLVSGDTGFYSMLSYVRKSLPELQLEVYPGINSVQYLLSKLGEGYEETELLSLHGRELDLVEKLRSGKPLGLLTDKSRSLQYVLEKIRESGETREVILGERLSYPDERISFQPLESEYEPNELSVILVTGNLKFKN